MFFLCLRLSCSVKSEKESLELNAVLAVNNKDQPLRWVCLWTGDPRPHSRSLQAEAVRRGPLNVGACQAQEPREASRAVLNSRSAASPAAVTRGHHQHSLGQLLDCAYTGYHLSCIADFSSFQTLSSSVRMVLALVPFHRQGN